MEFQLHPWSILINHEEDNITWYHGYNDIYIPIPYDPNIPGVRCVDAEEVEKVDIANYSDGGGEDIGLQDPGQGDDLNPTLSIEEAPDEENLQTRL